MGNIFELFQTPEQGITKWNETPEVTIMNGAYTNDTYTPDRFGGASGPVVIPEPTELIPLMLVLSSLTGLGRNRRKRITPPHLRS
jgi:hypothetical protein